MNITTNFNFDCSRNFFSEERTICFFSKIIATNGK
jgi:hypothetical protein